jgi:outer membrane receptor protein involved in Fe transport
MRIEVGTNCFSRIERNIIKISLASLAVAFSAGSIAQVNYDQGLQEIHVTATRSDESINKVPLTITAISGDELNLRNIQNVDDIFEDAPSVTFYRTQSGGGDNSDIVIRGIESNTGAGTTGVYIDDTPIQIHKGGLSYTAQNDYPDIFDLERVEILQGPQGTLFGSGSMGGAVRFITRQPSLDTDSLYTKVSQGFTEGGGPSSSVGIAFGGPIIDNVVGYRISADYHMDGGWVDHTSLYNLNQQAQRNAAGEANVNDESFSESNSNWRRTYTVRGALTYAPNADLTITPSLTYQNIYQNALPSFYNFFSNPSQGDFVNASGVNEFDADHYTLGALTARYNFSGFSLFSNTAYYDRDQINQYSNTACNIECTPAGFYPVSYPNYFPPDPTIATTDFDHNQQRNFSEEIRIQSADRKAPLTWQFGLFYDHEIEEAREYAPIDLSTINAIANAYGYPNYLALFNGNALLPGNESYETFDQVIESHRAIFGEVNYKFFERLTLTAGVRVDKTNQLLTSFQGGPYAGSSALSGYNAHEKETPVTPKFSLTYQIDDANMAYTTIAKGTRPGGSNGVLPASCTAVEAAAGLTGFTGAFKGDDVWSYEIGAKNKLFDNRVSFDTSVYWINWTGIQESQFLAGNCNAQVTYNGNSLTSKGVSFQTHVLLTDGLSLIGTFGYDDAKFTRAALGAPEADGQRPILINVGDGIAGAPPVTASLALQYNRVLFSRPSFARVDYHYISKENAQPQEDPATTAYAASYLVRPQTSVANFRVGMSFDSFQATIFVTNFTNAHPLYQTNNGSLDGVQLESETLRPLTVGFTGTYKF